MIVQDMVRGANFTSGWKFEANCEGSATCDWERVSRHWLKPHQGVLVVLLILLVNLGVERGKVDSIRFAGNYKTKVMEWVAREWLVKGIVSNNVWVLGESG